MDQDNWIVHVAEARKRLIIVGICFMVTFAAGLYAAPGILLYLKSQPLAEPIAWNVFSFTDGILIYMKCALIFALMFTVPVLLYQLWAFVKPGLTEHEAKSAFPFIPVAFMLFLAGLSFSYYVVFPMMLKFMKRMNQTIGAIETYGIDRYFGFLFDLVIPMAIAFELPVVILFLTRIGLLTPDSLKKTRKYAYLGLAILGSCISPPDFVSHLSVTIPLILLFEISVYVSGRQWRKMQSSPSGS
ncbi:sec-independent protein translocase protein TatC [Paenibacillus rhizosphaerae]|uniref:Sec-independent protein translocase protein TatC n=1 Tax=Paenibacillus rhizosphaerae TaxID=297318 RepID=A0A839TW34_9BACL|nr:twin-arginine translocase subunit TatC [Paenibacillus rhizosphaerae]MBB3130721.1 sec-independent protein translocase protein TatC [Paenibacillus rhizosphaerae]